MDPRNLTQTQLYPFSLMAFSNHQDRCQAAAEHSCRLTPSKTDVSRTPNHHTAHTTASRKQKFPSLPPPSSLKGTDLPLILDLGANTCIVLYMPTAQYYVCHLLQQGQNQFILGCFGSAFFPTAELNHRSQQHWSL